MSARPELLLVHGAWHGSWAWDRLQPVLEADGWIVRRADLVSQGSATLGLDADADVVRRSLAENRAPTVVVGHSYGGVVVSEGAAGADNLAGLVYLCAAQLDVGEAVWTDHTDPAQVPYWIEVDAAAGMTRAIDGERIFYNGCPADAAAVWVSRLRPQSLSSFLMPQTAAAWRDAPSAYLITEQDQCLDIAVQEAVSARAGLVRRLDAGHSPFLSHPREVADFLDVASAGF